MSETAKLILKIIGFIITLFGLYVVYRAPKIADRRHLSEKKKLPPDFEEVMTKEEKDKYCRDMANTEVKLYGLFIAIPGLLLLLFGFRS